MSIASKGLSGRTDHDVASFLFFSFVRSALTGTPWLASAAPITGPMHQFLIFLMVTDPNTTVRPRWGQAVVVVVVALVETLLRLAEIVSAVKRSLRSQGDPVGILGELCALGVKTSYFLQALKGLLLGRAQSSKELHGSLRAVLQTVVLVERRFA